MVETVVTVERTTTTTTGPPGGVNPAPNGGGFWSAIRLNLDYFRTIPGILKIVQLVSTLSLYIQYTYIHTYMYFTTHIWHGSTLCCPHIAYTSRWTSAYRTYPSPWCLICLVCQLNAFIYSLPNAYCQLMHHSWPHSLHTYMCVCVCMCVRISLVG